MEAGSPGLYGYIRASNFSKMNILILGSEGFIGRYLVNYFISCGHVITGCDIVESSPATYQYQKLSILSSDFDSLFDGNFFDVCINAAGSGNVAYSIAHPLSDFEGNTASVAKVLDTLRKQQPSCKYVHISSAAVYGNPLQLPIVETDKPAPLSPYGYHKWISEISCLEYYQIFALPIAIIRPFSVFGNGLKKQILWDICTKLMAADTVELFGTGNESRDFIHINDLVLLIDLVIAKSNFNMGIYNAASGTETSIHQIARIFEKHFDDSKTIHFSGQQKKGDPLNWVADITKVKALGFTNKTLLEKGIAEYIHWFKLNAGEQ